MRSKYNAVILMILCLVLWSGCESESDQVYDGFEETTDNLIENRTDSHSQEEDEQETQGSHEEISGDLQIYVHNKVYVTVYDELVSRFNQKYPNITVSYVGPGLEASSTDDGYTRTSVDLMSGTAGDMINLSGLPYFQYAANDLLEDLYPYMEEDESFNIQDYYTNIFEALEIKEGLYAMPTGFSYWCARLNQTMLDDNKISLSEFETLNYKDLSEMYHKVEENNQEVLISQFWNQIIFEENEYMSYLDEDQKIATFDSIAFIEFLNEMKSIRWRSEEEIAKANFIPIDQGIDLDENDLCFFVQSFYTDERNARLFSNQLEHVADPLPLSGLNGDKAFTIPDNTFAITSSSEHKDLAWLFIRFCIEEREIEDLDLGNNWFVGGYPINRNNTLKLLNKAFGEDHQDLANQVDSWNAERNEVDMFNYRYALLRALSEISDDFYGGRMTAEACAQEIQERVEIYLKE